MAPDESICAGQRPNVNYSHPLEFAPALEPGDWIERVRGFRPNAALMEKQALCKIGHLVDGDLVELGEQMGALARRHRHMDVWVGCCGTWDEHLDAIATNVVRLINRPMSVFGENTTLQRALNHCPVWSE